MSAINEERMSEENRGSLNSKKPSKADVSHSNNISATPSQNVSFIKPKAVDSKETLLKTLGMNNLMTKVSKGIDGLDNDKSTVSGKGQEVSTKIEEIPDQCSNHSQGFKKANTTEDGENGPAAEKVNNKCSAGGSSLKSVSKLTTSSIILKGLDKNKIVSLTKKNNLEVEKVISNLKVSGYNSLQLVFDKKKDIQPPIISAVETPLGTVETVETTAGGSLTSHPLSYSSIQLSQNIPSLNLFITDKRDSADHAKNRSIQKLSKDVIATNPPTNQAISSGTSKKPTAHRRTHSDTHNFPSSSAASGIVNSARIKQTKHPSSNLVKTSAREKGEKYDNLLPLSASPVKQGKSSEFSLRISHRGEQPKKSDFTVNFSKKSQVSTAKAEGNVSSKRPATEIVKELKKENTIKKKENLLLKEENQILKQENLAYRIMLDQNPALIDKCFPLIDVIHKNMGPLKTSLDSQVLQDAPDLLENCSHIIKKESPGRGHVKAVSLSESTPNQGKLTSCGKNKKSSQDLRGPLTRKTESNQSAKDVRSSLTKLTENSLSAKDVRKIKK